MLDIQTLPEYQKFCSCIEKNALFTPESSVVAAVSGGADSVCMLLFLHAYLPADRITVAHMNHGIRGEEAVRDADFVQRLSESLQVNFVLEEVDIPALSRKSGIGIEGTAREYRYVFLNREAKLRNAVVAVAHNREDWAETVLMNIARGTSLDGLKGISYKRGNIVRPILDLSRKEVEFVCSVCGITPMTDSTNLTDFTRRNKVRHEILPYLSQQFDCDIVSKLLNLATLAGKDSAYLNSCAEIEMAAISHLIKTVDGVQIKLNRLMFAEKPQAIQYRVIRKILSVVTGTDYQSVYPEEKDLTFDITRRVTEHVLYGKSGKVVEAGRNLKCRIEYDFACFYIEEPRTNSEFDSSVLWEETETKILPRSEFKEEELRAPKTGEYELFDRNALRELGGGIDPPIVLRNPQPGDRFFPFGASGSTTLRKFLIDRKIPISARRKLNVVAIGHEILWIPGIRRTERYKITENTEHILLIKIKPEAINHG